MQWTTAGLTAWHVAAELRSLSVIRRRGRRPGLLSNFRKNRTAARYARPQCDNILQGARRLVGEGLNRIQQYIQPCEQARDWDG